MTVRNNVTDTMQGAYPFLTALKWQGDRARQLSNEEAIALYERNWRFVDVLATPSESEIQYILQIADQQNSWLTNECRQRINTGKSELVH